MNFNWPKARNSILIFAILVLAHIQVHAAFALVEYCDIYAGNEKIFAVSNTSILSAIERGEQINERMRHLVTDSGVDLSRIEVKTGLDGVPVIVLDGIVICGVTAQDAREADKSQLALANEWRDKIIRNIAPLREALAKRGSQTTPGGDNTTDETAGFDANKNSKDDNGHRPHNTNLSEHAVLLLFIEISILLFASLACGELMVALGQPAIIGQILAGLLLGQSFFGLLFPDLSSQLFPRDGSQSRLIEAISWIGVSFLLMLTGMETDTAMLKKLGKPALYIAIIGLLGPLLMGSTVAFFLPAELISDPQNRLPFAVFLGTVFAASSVPVVAKILMDMKMLRLELGQLIIAASLSHDLLCCLLLAIIVVLSGTGGDSGASPIVTATVGTTCFLLAIYFGRPVIFTVLRWVNDHLSTRDGLITGMVVLLLASAAITQAIGVHIVLGAFAAGLILSQTPVVNHKVVRPLEIVTMAFFGPIFFASAGLNVNLTSLLDPQLGTITILISLAALGIKVLSCQFAGKLSGLGLWESISIGVGANAKGSLGLILATLGYSLNIITLDMFAVVIFVSLFSTAVAAPLMKLTMKKVKVSDLEIENMKKEERQSRTILGRIRRVLWPSSGKARNTLFAHLLNTLGQKQIIETTALYVKPPTAKKVEHPFASISKLIDRKHVSFLKRSVSSDNPIEIIVEEANRGYDLVLMATDEPAADADYVFGNLVDSVMLQATTKVLVLYEPNPDVDRQIKKVLVPVSGSELSLTAAEFGISLAKSLNASVTCLSIAESASELLYGDETQSGNKIERNISEEIEASLRELAVALDVPFDAVLVQTAAHPAQAVVLTAQQHDIDLIVVGAEAKIGPGLFLGHMVNFLLRNAPCAIAVLKMNA